MADIILSNISKRFGDKTLFENFSLKIEQGEFISIMGESGAGKTTLLNMMGLLDRPDSGTDCPLWTEEPRIFIPDSNPTCAAVIFRICFRTTA